MYSVIDTGTTNTRIYIVKDTGEIVAKAYRKVGVRDTAISGSKKALVDGIVACFHDALANGGLREDDINLIFVSGMLTSELGLIDLPHICAPAGTDELVEQCVITNNTDILPFDIPIAFIRGIKNNTPATYDGLISMDFMRGEETQVVGVLRKLKPQMPCFIIFLSSHTKIISVDETGHITNSMTTMSGQIFEAIKKETFIGKSVAGGDEQKSTHKTDILKAVYRSVNDNGLLRTLMMPRFMEVLMESQSQDRAFCLDAAIACDDMKTLAGLLKSAANSQVIFIGHENRCLLYQQLFEMCGLDVPVQCIFDKQEIDTLTVSGAVSLIEKIVQHK